MSTTNKPDLNMEIKPIGIVRNDKKEPSTPGWEKGLISEIILDESLKEFTDGLEEFSHIIVIFWMHKFSSQRGTSAKVHPRGRQDFPLVGLFATRSPRRPNPLGMSIVKLLSCQGNILRVEGFDAIDGSPVIDIKPYLPSGKIDDAHFPQWVHKS